MQTPDQNVRIARRLQRSIVVYFVVGLLLSGMSILALSLWLSFEHLKTMHDRELSTIIEGRRSAIEEYVTRVSGIASQIASRTMVRERLQAYNRGELSLSGLAAVSRSALEDGRASTSDLLAIVRRARDGEVVMQVGTVIADDLLSVVPGHESAIKMIHLQNMHALLVVAPILDRQGASVGSDVVVFSADALQKLITVPNDIGAPLSITLGRLGDDGNAMQIADTPLRGEHSNDVWGRAELAAITRASAGDTGRIVTDEPGEESAVVAYAPIRNTDWGLAVRVTRSELYAPMWRQLGIIATWLVLLLVGGVTVTLVFTRTLSGKALVQTDEWLEQLKANEQAEQALQRRTHIQQTILDTVNQGIAMVDDSLRIITVNRRYCELMNVPDELLQPGRYLADIIRYNAQRGEHGMRDVETVVRERIAMWRRDEYQQFERTRPNGTLLQVEIQPASGGGTVLTYTDITERRRTEERAAHFGRLLDESLNEIFVFDAVTLRFIYANQGAQRNLGYTMSELYELAPVDITPEYSMDEFVALLEPLTTQAKSRLTLVTSQRRKNGSDYMAEMHLQRSHSDGRDVFVAMILDVSEREMIAAAMRGSEARYRALYDDNPSMFFTIDAQGQIVSVNRFGAGQLGYTPEALIGKPISSLRIDFDEVLEREFIQTCLDAPGVVHRRDISKRHFDGRTIWVRESARAVLDAADDEYILLVCEDVTEMRKLSEQLAHYAAHDTLTGLPNRREFESQLDAALASAAREGYEHALCYLDLDQFKVVNDTSGHMAGDELLRQIAKLLLGAVRNSDTLARLGGDEFGLLVTRCPLSSAEHIANTLRALIEDFHFVWEDKSFRIGVSIGVVPITRRYESRAALMSDADAACYAAKDGGRNRVHVLRHGDVEVARHQGEMTWIGRIQEALEHDYLQLDFQSIKALSADTSEGEHYELLVRLVEPDAQGVVAPGQFLPVAERYNLAARIDRWVISTAFGWLARHPAHLARLSMCSINLSGVSLTDENFADFILDTFHNTGVPPGKICFEITETAAISNLTSAMRLVSQLHDVGCCFALDDFGSGLSSFGYLKHLPVEFVKIDGMFIKDILEDPIDFAMVRSINDIAHVLGKRTIAEFVESEAILEAVRELGIDYAQGYAIGRSRPLATLPDEDEPPLLALN